MIQNPSVAADALLTTNVTELREDTQSECQPDDREGANLGAIDGAPAVSKLF
jgi:hypothetical protein